MKRREAGFRRAIILILGLAGAGIGAPAATILTDNLGSPSSGSDAVSGGVLLAADFSTDSNAYSLDSATLPLQSDSPGKASLSLYSDNGGIPGSLLATLSSPVSYSSSFAATAFTASGVTLSPHTTYWLVLGALSGSFEWSWTSVNSGSGAGYTGDSAYFDGSYWYGASGVYPYQLTVTADPVSALTTPEPASFALLLVGSLGFAFLARRVMIRGKEFQEKASD